MRAVFAGFEPAALVFSPGRSVQRSNRALTASEEVSGRTTGKGPWSPSGPTLSRRIGARLLQPRCPDAARDGSWWNEVSPPSLPGKFGRRGGIRTRTGDGPRVSETRVYADSTTRRNFGRGGWVCTSVGLGPARLQRAAVGCLATPRGNWCGRRDLHPHRACAHRHLGPARLPISPHPRKIWSGGPESHRSPRGHNAMLCLLELRTWKDGPPPVAKPWIRFRRSPRQSRRTVEIGRSGRICTCVVSVPSRVPETARLRFEKLGAGVGVAPTSPGLMRPGGTTGSTRSGKLVEPRGVAPRSARLQRAAFTGLAWTPWTRRRDLNPRSTALQAGPFDRTRARRAGKTCTAAQVARRRKTSPASALSDRRSGSAPRPTSRRPRRK